MYISHLPIAVRRFLYSEVFIGLSLGMFSFLQALHMLEVGLDEKTIGEIISFSGILMGFLSLPSVFFANWIGRKKTFILGLFILGLSFFVYALGVNSLIFYIGQSLYGVGAILMQTSESTLLYSYCKNAKDEAKAYNFLFGIFSLFYSVGIFIGGFIPILFKGYASKFQGGLFLAAILIFALSLMRSFILPEINEKNNGAHFLKPSVNKKEYKKMLLALIFIFFLNFGIGWTVNFLNIIIIYRFVVTAELASTILSVNGISLFLGSFAVPLIFNKMGVTRSMKMISYLCIVTSFLLFFNMPLTAFIIILFVRSGVVLMLANMGEGHTLSVIKDEYRNLFSGLKAITRNFGLAGSTYFVGIIIASKNYQLPFLFSAVSFAVVLLYLVLYSQKIFTDEEPKVMPNK